MNDSVPSKEQAAFEAWLNGPASEPTISPDNPYRDSDWRTQHMYEVWCAAWNARAAHEPPAEPTVSKAIDDYGPWTQEQLAFLVENVANCLEHGTSVPPCAAELRGIAKHMRAAQPPVPEPHVIKQIEHALQDNPGGISREMADYIRGCISDYRHALTKEASHD
jgi:hypothetical protein